MYLEDWKDVLGPRPNSGELLAELFFTCYNTSLNNMYPIIFFISYEVDYLDPIWLLLLVVENSQALFKA